MPKNSTVSSPKWNASPQRAYDDAFPVSFSIQGREGGRDFGESIAITL
jgi:hypothetical protein